MHENAIISGYDKWNILLLIGIMFLIVTWSWVIYRKNMCNPFYWIVGKLKYYLAVNLKGISSIYLVLVGENINSASKIKTT